MKRFTRLAIVACVVVVFSIMAASGGTKAAPAETSGTLPVRAVGIEVVLVDVKAEPKTDWTAKFSGVTEEVGVLLRELESKGVITGVNRFHVATLEGRKAWVRTGEAVMMPTDGVNARRNWSGQTTLQRQRIGTELTVTPWRDGDAVLVSLGIERSRLKPQAEAKAEAKAKTDEGVTPPSIEELEYEAIVRISPGETVAAGRFDKVTDGDASLRLVLVSARVFGTIGNEKTDAIGGKKEKEEETIKVFSLQHASAEMSAMIVDGLFDGRPRRVRVVMDPRTRSVIVRGSGEDLATVEAILLRLDVETPQAGPKPDAPARKPTPRPDSPHGYAKWLQKGRWVTLLGEETLRVMTDEQKARAEAMRADYERRMDEYRNSATAVNPPNVPGPVVAHPFLPPMLAKDLRGGGFLKVVSLGEDFVELKGGKRHLVIPLDSIRLIRLGVDDAASLTVEPPALRAAYGEPVPYPATGFTPPDSRPAFERPSPEPNRSDVPPRPQPTPGSIMPPPTAR